MTRDISVGFQTRHSYVSTRITVIFGLLGVRCGSVEHQLGHRRSEVVDELVGQVHWYLFRGSLMTSTVERYSFVSSRGNESGMATSYIQREKY